jgi:aspartyl-tRNA(Asn)/glutamyl-tRNA(Gln) amidotransferase subunit C
MGRVNIGRAYQGAVQAVADPAVSRGSPGRLRPGRCAMIGAMPGLSRGDVEHVAHLARLGLTADELSLLEGQLNHILDQYAKLAELDTDEIAPTAQTIELENILREDIVVPSLTVEEALANAPLAAGGYIVSPPILSDESGG